MKKIAQSKKSAKQTKTTPKATAEQPIPYALAPDTRVKVLAILGMSDEADDTDLLREIVMQTQDFRRGAHPAEATPSEPHTLADLGITPARAWALHRFVADGQGEEISSTTIEDGLRRGAVRVMHESYGLIAVYVTDDLTDEKGNRDEQHVHSVIVGTRPAREADGRFCWRSIGYWHDRFVDYVDILAGNYLDPLPATARKAVA